MNLLPFSIGIISWKGYDSLENSLISYEKNGLSNLTNDKFICLPEYTEEGIKLAKRFEYIPILLEQNIGILGHLKKLVNEIPEGPILLLENDLELIENKETTYNQIKTSIDYLSKYKAIQVRLRNRFNPGDPFVGIEKYKQYWSDNFFSNIKRLFRPAKAQKLIGNSIYLLENPEKEFFKIAKFMEKLMDCKFEEEKINNAIKSTSFQTLQKLEEKGLFTEQGKGARFFNSGPNADWKSQLDKNIVDEINLKFKNEMVELGYL